MRSLIVMKNYYLLLALICSAFSCAMEREEHRCNDKCYEIVRKRIDTEILGVQSEGLLGSLSCAITSYRQCPTDREGTIKALCEVESKIPAGCSSYKLFLDLHNRHWHFGYLIKNAIPYKHEQWDNITGATVGSLLSNLSEKNIDHRLSERLHSYIHVEACQPYGKKKGLYKDLERINFDLDDIHYAVLPGTTAGTKFVHLIQSDGYKFHVGKTRWDDSITFYDLDDENECAQGPCQIIYTETCPANQYKVHRCGHMIVFGLVNLACISAIMKNLYTHSDDKKIVVFAHPTFESYLCSKAFAASKNNKQELITMHEFVEKTTLVQGFVKKNLLQKIINRLQELEG
jgi:hypothetical protein